MKNIVTVIIVALFIVHGLGSVYAADPVIIKGIIEEINEEGGYIVVDGTKIITDERFLEYAFYELGDAIEVTVEQGDGGLNALDYTYSVETDEDSWTETVDEEIVIYDEGQTIEDEIGNCPED